jgi:transcriptional regulator with XRE-family HTH domain
VRKGEVTVRKVTLKAFRKKSGMSQVELAVAATECLRSATGDQTKGISESLIALIETGARNPSRENGEAIAAALDVPFLAIGDIHIDAESDAA